MSHGSPLDGILTRSTCASLVAPKSVDKFLHVTDLGKSFGGKCTRRGSLVEEGKPITNTTNKVEITTKKKFQI